MVPGPTIVLVMVNLMPPILIRNCVPILAIHSLALHQRENLMFWINGWI